MAQHDYNIANQSFPSFRTDLNNALSAIQTCNSGTSRPTGAVAGQIWLDTTSATSPTLKYYDGADDISLATIDHVGNTVNWLDSTVSVTGLSTTATGTVLTLTDTVTTSSVNLIIDNQKEIRFNETTANGTNYVALKAPASVSADLTFTLPATDGTNGQVLSTNGSGVLSFITPASGISWQSVPKFANFTAVAGEGYFCDTLGLERTVSVQSVSGNNKFFIGGVQQPTLELVEGNTYVFNYPSAHPFAFSTTSDGTHGGGTEYTTGITRDTVNYKLTYVVPSSAPTLYYYCTIHSGMGGQANTPTTQPSFTVTLPTTPTAGQQIAILDYAGTFATNNLIITSTSKINSSDDDVKLTTNREATIMVYTDSTQGWLAYSGVNEGTSPSLTNVPPPYSVDFLIIGAGGGGGKWTGGGGGAGGYRNSYSTETSGGGGSSESVITFSQGTVYTVTVGAGGAGSNGTPSNTGTAGNNSLISGTGLSTITSTGGGGGGGAYGALPTSGGSGGGTEGAGVTGGAGTANQGYAGGVGSGAPNYNGGGGGGASAVGGNGGASAGNGGNGLASSITASSVTRAGGGGGGANGSTGGTGGTGGGGNGTADNTTGGAGSANTGGGGGAGGWTSASGGDGGAGGSGVIILRMPTASYSGTTTGSPTVTTSGADTILVFNSSGSITG